MRVLDGRCLPLGRAAAGRRPVPRLRRACAAIVVLLAACSAEESTRGGGLIAPLSATAPTEAAELTPALVTVVASDGRSAVTAAGTDSTASAPRQRRSAAEAVLAAAEPPDGFGEGVLTVESAAGTQTWPVVIADTATARQQGLMGVADFGALGGYAAMVFVFEFDTSGAFWMRDTPLPLRITFVTAEGTVVSGADMTPCLAPTPDEDCERYFPDGAYRIAIERPLDPAFDLGLAAAELVEVTER